MYLCGLLAVGNMMNIILNICIVPTGTKAEKNLGGAEQRSQRARQATAASARSPATTPGCPLTARQPCLALPSHSVAPHSPETLRGLVVVGVTRLRL
jgi:hypothetical protein